MVVVPHLKTSALLNVLLSLSFLFAGCDVAPVNQAMATSKAFERAENAINQAKWHDAYAHLEGLFRRQDPAVQERVKELIEKHPAIITAAEEEILRRAKYQAEWVAGHDPSEAHLFSNIKGELEGYRAVAPDNYENLLSAVKKVYTQVVPIDFPGAELKLGMTTEEALRVIGREPTKQTVIHIGDGPGGELSVFEYTFLVEASADKKVAAPIWMAFYKSNLIRIGYGGAREAEYSVYAETLLQLARAKKVKYVETARALAARYLYLFGESAVYSREYWSYLALLGEQIDTGKITEVEAEYLLSKKTADIQQRLAELEVEKGRAQTERAMMEHAAAANAERIRQGQINQSLMMMGLGVQLMQLSRPVYQPPPRTWMNCTTRKIGNTLHTDCQ